MTFLRGRAPGLAMGALAAALWLCVALPTFAATSVFHSAADDGTPPAGPASIAEGGTQSVYLYIDGGLLSSAAGEACHVGAGDEVCGYELTIAGQSGLTLVGFTPDPGADLVTRSDSFEIVINGLDAVAPTPGPKRIGELQVNAVPGGSVELSSGEAVGADLGSEVLTAGTLVTVPEPGLLASLGAGILLLAGLRGRRETR